MLIHVTILTNHKIRNKRERDEIQVRDFVCVPLNRAFKVLLKHMAVFSFPYKFSETAHKWPLVILESENEKKRGGWQDRFGVQGR